VSTLYLDSGHSSIDLCTPNSVKNAGKLGDKCKNKIKN